jgi:hypothetical protein
MPEPAFERVEVDACGGILIPPPLLAALAIQPGDMVVAHLEDGRVVFDTEEGAWARLREDVLRKVPAGTDIVAALLAERREEARNDELPRSSE